MTDTKAGRLFAALVHVAIGFVMWLTSTILAIGTDNALVKVGFIGTCALGGFLVGIGIYRFGREWYA